MGQVIEAIYDGAVFWPTVPVTLKPNTLCACNGRQGRGTTAPGVSFLDTASSFNLDVPQTGPPTRRQTHVPRIDGCR